MAYAHSIDERTAAGWRGRRITEHADGSATLAVWFRLLRDERNRKPGTVMTLHAVTGKRVADAMVRFPKTHGAASRLHEIRAFFEDDHVHMALIVTTDRRLITTIERPDLAAAIPAATPAAELGTLAGRTARPTDRLDALTAVLRQKRRRRLAVVDDAGRLLGLLCLKKDGTGYCSEEGIRDRANQARRSRIE